MPDTRPQSQATDQALQDLLIRHEGLKLRPYRDTVGKLTIGVGRNLDDTGITREEALLLLNHDLARVQAGLDTEHPWWRSLDPVRQRALIDITFNLGLRGLDGFKLTLAGLRGGAFSEAAREVLRSPWAKQVGQRAYDVAEMISKGVEPVLVPD